MATSACSSPSSVASLPQQQQQQQQQPSPQQYKRPRAAPVATFVPTLPPSIAWLESTALEMTATNYHCHTDYILRVHYHHENAATPISWQVTHTFEDYRAFQQRLLKAMAYGHACSAECKWLHSFIKKYFPKKALFGNCSPSVMAKRREKLIKCMNVLMASLLNRGNHGCGVVVNHLATEFMHFIQGDNRFALVSKSIYEDEEKEELSTRCSTSSFVSTTSTDAGDHDHTIDELFNSCDLCDSSLDSSSSSSSDTSSDSPSHWGNSCSTTTLSCGHQFHDACVIPKLEELEYCCPTCNEPQLE